MVGRYSRTDAVQNKPWQPYSPKKLEWLLANNKTVLIDFTADWCPNCKWNERNVLKTDATAEVLKELDVYTLIADWTHRDEAVDVTAKLEELRAKNIPLVAIYGAGNGEEPILIPGVLTHADLHAKLRRAAIGDVTRAMTVQLRPKEVRLFRWEPARSP